MSRGDIRTVSGAADNAGKLRPAVIEKDDSFAATASVTICAFTTDETEAPLFRLLIEPSPTNGLCSPCRLLVDKITTVSRSKLGRRAGRLDDEDMVRLSRAMVVFLGIGSGTRRSRP